MSGLQVEIEEWAARQALISKQTDDWSKLFAIFRSVEQSFPSRDSSKDKEAAMFMFMLKVPNANGAVCVSQIHPIKAVLGGILL